MTSKWEPEALAAARRGIKALAEATSSLRPTPARANVDAAPGSAPGVRVCQGCGRPLLRRSLNTRFDIDFHKTCFVKSDEMRELTRLMAAVEPDNSDLDAIFDAPVRQYRSRL